MRQQAKHSATWVQDQSITVWVQNDPRSAAAMLRGKGDGRDYLYNQFVRIKLLENPAMELEQIDKEYSRYTRNMEDAARRQHALPIWRSAGRIGHTIISNLLPLVAVAWLMSALAGIL